MKKVLATLLLVMITTAAAPVLPADAILLPVTLAGC
jgi:hypothetical protein